MSYKKTLKDNFEKLGKEYISKMRNTTKRQESLKKNQIEILELENTMNEVKHAIQTIKSRMDEAENRICELETATLKFSSARRTKKKK